MIASLSYTELSWYSVMMEQDSREAYNKTIDYIDYLAAFSNPKGVEELRKRREVLTTQTPEDKEQFDSLIKNMFGREVEDGGRTN